MNKKLANSISTIGHPLLTIPIFVIVVLFKYEDTYKASMISALVLVSVIIPIAIQMYRGSKHGKYTNFDVSNKHERQSWYIVVLALMLMLTIIMFLTHQPYPIKWTTFFFLLLLVISKMANYFIKSSLHVSLNVFLTYLISLVSIHLAIAFFMFTVLVAWSRIALKRHTFSEVIIGSLIGLVVGGISYSVISI